MRTSRLTAAYVLAFAAISTPLAAQGVQRVNLDPSGQVADGLANPLLSADGRLAFFGWDALYVRDLGLGTTSTLPFTGNLRGVSSDGRFVLYTQYADFTFGFPSITILRHYGHVHDRNTGVDEVLSTGGIETIPQGISDDGRYLLYQRHVVLGSQIQVWLRDRVAGGDTLIDPTSFPALLITPVVYPLPTLSPDGRWVGFVSRNAGLVAGDTNGQDDAFVYDRTTATLTRASVGTGGVEGLGGGLPTAYGFDAGPCVSRVVLDRWIAFVSNATNLVPGDTNGQADVFLRDLQNDVTMRASIATLGAQSTEACLSAALSDDARHVFFTARDGGLVPGDVNGVADVFVRDVVASTTERLSVAADGSQANGTSHMVSITADGTRVGVRSEASNLVPGDTNGVYDAFVYEHPPCTGTRNFCAALPNSTGSPGTMEWSGSTSLAANQLTLRARQIPPSTLGIFLVSAQPQAPGTPFGNGLLCLTGSLRRLGVVQAVQGVASQTQNLAASAWVGLTHGDRRWFQFYFRDVAGGGALFNATDGLELVFCR